VTRLEQRLQVLRIRHTFAGAIAMIRRDMLEHDSLCDGVTQCQELRRVLEVALEVANTYNNQRAYGTRLGSLLDFLKMKASGNVRINMYHYLCSILQQRRPELYNFPDRMPFEGRRGGTGLPKPQAQIEIELKDILSQIRLAQAELALATEVEGRPAYYHIWTYNPRFYSPRWVAQRRTLSTVRCSPSAGRRGRKRRTWKQNSSSAWRKATRRLLIWVRYRPQRRCADPSLTPQVSLRWASMAFTSSFGAS